MRPPRPPRLRTVQPQITAVVLAAVGPPDQLRMFWLRLWQIRTGPCHIRRRTQAQLAALLGLPERTFRWYVEGAAHW